jgi:SET domain-containing protein
MGTGRTTNAKGNAKVQVKTTKRYGRGVFAKQSIRKGEIIGTFDGAVYDADFEDWTEDLLNHVIQFEKDKWRDSKGIARYLNHSCAPNCGIKGLFKIVAMRSIRAGEELTWDYEMTEANDWGWRMKCRCGAPDCRKVIGHYKNMPKSVRKKYGSYISEWLRPNA